MTHMNRILRESGATTIWQMLSVVFIITTVLFAGVMTWALINYASEKTTVDTQVSSAVSDAKKVQVDADTAKFNERDKQPNRQFVGPDDYGTLTFNYPKTWSIFVNKDGSTGSTYEAFFNPISVPPVSSSTLYALHVTIQTQDYDQVISSYTSLVKSGALQSSVVKSGSQTGTRLDGSFSKDLRGSAVIFKIRDKTAIIQTDANTFEGDFNALVQSLTFNV